MDFISNNFYFIFLAWGGEKNPYNIENINMFDINSILVRYAGKM